MSQQEFSGSIYNRKSSNNLELQQKLHIQFRNVFTQENITQLLSKLITQVMVSKSINPGQKDVIDQEMVLEESEVCSQDTLTESSAYELCILLCKNVIKCFKQEVKPLLQSLFLSVGQMNNQTATSTKQKIIQNTMQLILILPKIYDQHQLPLQHVMNLLSILYQNHQYAILARLIKNYHQYLNPTTLQNSFNVLSQIVSTPLSSPYITVDIIYQSALTMKKILTQNETDVFSFENFSACVINLLALLKDEKFTKTPTLMWPLIKLANQLLKLTNVTLVIEDVGDKILDCIFPLIETRESGQLTVCGLAETVETLMNIICGGFRNLYLSQQNNNSITINKATIKSLYAAYTLVINNISNANLQNVDALYLLWLNLVRSYPTMLQQEIFSLNKIQQMITLNNSMKELFTHLFQTVLEEESTCAVQVLEQYIVVGLVSLSEQQLIEVFQKMLLGCLQEHKDILKLLIQTLCYYHNQISPQINGLRTLLMLLINYMIMKYGVKQIYEMLSSFYGGNYAAWFSVYCWSGQYVSTYLRAMAQLGVQVFGNMLQSPIDGQYPLDTVLKTMVVTLESIKLSQAWITLSNMYKLILPTQTATNTIGTTTSRKVKLQLSGLIKETLVSDQRENYQKLVSQLFKFWDWGEDDVVERFDKITSNEILMLIKGTYKKEYDINEPD